MKQLHQLLRGPRLTVKEISKRSIVLPLVKVLILSEDALKPLITNTTGLLLGFLIKSFGFSIKTKRFASKGTMPQTIIN
jgi:hypothetical protein